MIAIISDTHENIPLLRRALDIIKIENVDFIVHCGDMVSPSTLKEFEGFPLRFVLGNNDGEVRGLSITASKMQIDVPTMWLDFDYKDARFLVVHDVSDDFIQERIDMQIYNYVLCGHTHVRRDERIFNTRIINPGALCFRTTQPGFALLDVENDSLRFVDV